MGDEKYDISIGIPEFYKDKTVLLTGFSGFVGKLIVEKLLYSCPDVKRIYVLIRSLKGKTSQERANEVIESMAFKRLHEENPEILKSKIVAIPGDVLEERLGLSQEDETRLREEVNIIFHGAASVRFDDPLNLAIQLNTLGTKKIVDLALTARNLECLTYISTAYSNCDNLHIKEELYPPKADWRKTLEICEKTDPATLQIYHEKYINGMPNTYAFSKALAEDVINDYRHQLPVVIVRPSIILPTWREPLPGWSDNTYGPIGFILGFFLGIVRCTLIDNKAKCNYIALDVVVNATIVATMKRSLSRKSIVDQDSALVYNVCSPPESTMDNHDFSLIYTSKAILDYMNEQRINFVCLQFSTSQLGFRINNLYRHVISAFFVDFIMVLLNKKPMLLKIRRKVFSAALALSYFTKTTFTFQTSNFDALLDNLSSQDKETFGWDFKTISVHDLYVHTFFQMKYTTLKLLYDNLDEHRKKLTLLYYIDRLAVYMTFSTIAFIIYYFSIPQAIFNGLISIVTLP